MCGIAGVVKFSGANVPWQKEREKHAALRRMSAAIAHRGPDGAGSYVDGRAGKAAALLHRRLAIIDLPGGAQPMGNEDSTVQVVFNGEIYNHAELRRELRAAGHVFRSDHSDTEVLAHGWEEWGVELPTKLLGMFAFAIWEEGRDTLFLARDRMGQKPLFYAVLEDGIVFGSTIPSVLAWPEVPRRVPREQIAAYLQLGYVPAPHTIWRDVNQVVPGNWVRVRGEVVDGGRYWSGMSGEDERRQTKDEMRGKQLRAELTRAVESQLMADVPIACFLSGGLDSSIIAMLMQQIVRRHGGDAIHTVAVGFSETAFDETMFASTVAKRIGSRHTRLEVNGAQDVMGTLRMLMADTLGQPFADSSILPTYHLSRVVREIAPVALSGDGSDELFAGYDRYRAIQLLRRWAGVAKLLPESVPVGSLGKRERYRRLAAAAREKELHEQYSGLTDIFSPEDQAALLGEIACVDAIAADRTPLRHAMFTDQHSYLPGDVLWKVDSAAMACALEVRSPFLDHHVVEFANALPEDQLIKGTRGKRILRETFEKDLPLEVLSRRKQGFAVPIGTWFRGSLREDLHEALLAEGSFVAEHLDSAAVKRLVEEHNGGKRDHTHRLFALLMMELWAREFKPVVE